MYNKPIIDGVDVSECIFYQANFEEDFDVKIKHFCSNWHNSCESVNNSNCYFKQLTRKTQECEELKKECNEYFELMAIRTEVLAKIANKLGINTAIIENKEIFNKIGQLKTEIKRLQKSQFCYAYEKDCHKVCKQQNCIIKNGYKAEQKLEKITKIANGMHDMWINKTKYTDVYNLAEHLLNCELNRIINEFDEIDEVE